MEKNDTHTEITKSEDREREQSVPVEASESPQSALHPTEGGRKANLLTPLAIVVGFGLVALSLYFSDGNRIDTASQAGGGTNVAQPTASPEREESANIYGDPDAPVTIVEFSDYECPFCARLHPTLKRIVDESDGGINWEYRHLPLPSHRNAGTAALVGECVAKHVGNDAFWDYTDMVFREGPGDQSFYEDTGRLAGLSDDHLSSCQGDASLEAIVRDDLETARSLGGSGTPFNVIVFSDGSTKSVRGALPYENWAATLGL